MAHEDEAQKMSYTCLLYGAGLYHVARYSPLLTIDNG